MATKRIIKYKCMYCEDRFTREDLVSHVEENHMDMVPKDFTPLRLVFNYVNKKPLNYHGKCTECGGHRKSQRRIPCMELGTDGWQLLLRGYHRV